MQYVNILLDIVIKKIYETNCLLYMNVTLKFLFISRHNNGHVTQNQFRQCLRMLDLNATEAELAAIEAIFCNDVGFNYIAFVSQLQPKETPKFMYQEIQDLLNQTNQQRRLPERNCMSDLENVLLKIKTKVSVVPFLV